MMYQIEERLKQAFPEESTEPFGGISLVIMGYVFSLSRGSCEKSLKVVIIIIISKFQRLFVTPSGEVQSLI